MAEHKHAAVLRAIADGKAVQYRHEGMKDYAQTVHPEDDNPISKYWYEWRIKPEPKPDVVVHGKAVREKAYCTGMRTAFYSFAAQHDAEDNLRLVFDGETGKLKSAEVLL